MQVKQDPFQYVVAFLQPAAYPRRLAVSLVTLHMLWTTAAWSQRSWTLFGPCSDRGLGYAPRSLALATRSQSLPAEIAVLDADRPRVLFYTVDGSGTLMLTDSLRFSHPQRSIAAADMDGDSIDDFVTLGAGFPEVTLIKRTAGGHTQATIPAVNAQRLAIADINNDRRPDILLFGRTTAGVATLLGDRRGAFNPGPVLFPDISVSDLAVADLNGDGINDVFLLNWLSNQLAVFYGITRTVFSEQLTVDIPGEPAEIALSPVTTRRTVRVAVTIPSERHIAVFDGNALGEFNLAASIDCPAPPSGVRFVDVNGDRFPDIVSATARGLLVLPGEGPSRFGAPALYGAVSLEGSWAVGDADGDGRPDLIAAGHATGILEVIANAAGTGSLAPLLTMSVGEGPRGVAIADLNGDGMPDIAVANALSGTVSVLLNQGEGKLAGQLSITVPDQPSQIVPFRSGDHDAIVAAHASTDRITVLDLDRDPRHVSPYSMPTGQSPSVMDARVQPERQALEIVVSSRRSRDGGVGISSFEQLSGGQFLERTLHPNAGSPVLAAAVDRPPRDGTYGLLFAAGSRSTRSTVVYSASPSAAAGYGAVTPVFRYPDSTSSTRLLLWGDRRPDSSRSAAVVLGEPQNAILAFHLDPARGATTTSWLRDVHPVDDQAVVLTDADNDGCDDLLVLDAEREALLWYRGRPDGTYAEPVSIVEESDLGGFAVGPLRTRDRNDLAYTRRSAGTLTVIIDPFRGSR